jgi:RHH-type proline utilization regulon transcriptional repressor/proline dehydrogenase/delta 1-pyrroline-5-carboxylate dehydrogenase
MITGAALPCGYLDGRLTAMSQHTEALIGEIGRRLFTGVRERRPLPLSKAWCDDQAMMSVLTNERAKAQLFRFIDVLPALRSDADVTRHLREYLAPVAPLLPRPLAAVLPWVGLPMPWAWPVAAAARLGARLLARKFVAGGTMEGMLESIVQLRRQSLAFTVDVLGEAVVSDDESRAYQATYLELIDRLGSQAGSWPAVAAIDRDHQGDLPRVNLSIKLSALVARFDPCDPVLTSRAVRSRLRPLLRRAQRQGAFVNIDMEQYAYKDATLAIFKTVLEEEEFRRWRHVGIAIQAYLRDSLRDLQDLASWARRRGTPVWIRLVKGAYHDFERVQARQNGWPIPVHTDKRASDASFEALTHFLLLRRDLLRPAIASHNVRSISHALALCQELAIPPRCIEFQMLHGMADQLKSTLVDLGQRVRVYSPFGRLLPGMAYLVRRLLENTSNQSFVRAGFLEHRDERELLMKPSPLADRGLAAPQLGLANAPPADFSRAESRAAMADALTRLRGELAGQARRCPLVIAGQMLSTQRELVSRNPSRNAEVVARAACATREHAQAAVAGASQAFPAWRDTPIEVRAQLLERVAAGLSRQRLRLSAMIVLEAGKGITEADADVCEAIDFCRYYALEMRRLGSARRRDVPGEENSYFYEGRGVCVVISPWNFPLAILCGMCSAALVAGNTVIMKPAEQTPGIAAELMDVFSAAGAPAGVINYLPGIGEEIGPVLVGHPQVSMIAFTGSQAVGLAINRLAAEVPAGACEVKRVICEMGGKNAIIVDDDADLDEAVLGVMHSAFDYQGQKCSACSRAIVLSPIYDAFCARLIAATRSLAIGPADEPSSVLGPVIDEEAMQRINERIAEATREHRLAYQGQLPVGCPDGWYIPPHIFVDVASQSRLAQEEIFGPVLAIIRAADIDDALAIANGTAYALTGGLYSRSPARIALAKRALRVGNLYINRRITGALVDRQPFGGFKLSGIGSKAGGPDYLLQFLLPRCVTENTLRHGFTPETA